MRFYTATITVDGGNFPLLLKRLRDKGVDVLNVKKVGFRRISITINKKDLSIYFAISKNMWYNKSVEYGGLLYFLQKIWLNSGVIIGMVLFLIINVFAEGLVLGIDLEGDGSYFYSEISTVLNKHGIDKFSVVTKKDLQDVERDILLSSPLVAFATVKKNGTRLSVEVVKAKEPVKKLDTSIENVVALNDCKIIEIKVYRGTKLKDEGDTVLKGEVIVGGYYVFKEELFKTYVVGKVVVESSFTYRYDTEFAPTEEVISLAVAIAKNQLDKEVVKTDVSIDKNGVSVTLYYREMLIGG